MCNLNSQVSDLCLDHLCLSTGVLRRGGTEELCRYLHNPDNLGGVITHLEPDILESEVKWALESITMNKVSRGDGILVELFKILNDDIVKVLQSICQQIWKTQQ